MSEKHTGRNEMYEVFDGVRFTRRNTVRSLKSARAWGKKYAEQGYLFRVEKERPGFYNVYTRSRRL